MAETGDPADKTKRMSGPEEVTLVNELIASTESPIGSNDLFKDLFKSTSSATRQGAAVSKSNDSGGLDVTVRRTLVLLAGISAVALAAVIFFLQL